MNTESSNDFVGRRGKGDGNGNGKEPKHSPGNSPGGGSRGGSDGTSRSPVIDTMIHKDTDPNGKADYYY